MKKIYFLFASVFAFVSGNAQGDFCAGAATITPTLTNCSWVAGTSNNATQTMPGCSGNADDDVWYTFVANSSTMTIKVDPTPGYDPVIQVFSGTGCSGASLGCRDVNGLNGDEEITLNNLTNGNTYTFRVYHYGVGSGSSNFNVCVTGLAPATNNTPCNSFALPAVTPSCNFQTYTNLGSAGSNISAPNGCGGSAPHQGGYQGGDVWFSVVVPPSGELDIHTLSMDFSDGAMALYSGSCFAPVLVACDDDNGVGSMPYINQTGLTPGATMYIRVWEYGNNNNGQFGLCVSTPTNDDCANAQWICDLNGYGGITSSAYTIDLPSNMTGTGQNGVPNSNPNAPFGQNYSGNSPNSPIQIDNNSWLAFTASATSAQFWITVHSCQNNNGMQMQIFQGTNCSNFIAVSNMLETTNSQAITATGLTPGQTYYIMVDGFAGDICSYTISATSGVDVVEAIPQNYYLCAGNSTSITAQVSGNTSNLTYSWTSTPPGSYPATQTINVTPSANTVYQVSVSGMSNCGGVVTTATCFITVDPNPTANITYSPTPVCASSPITLNGIPTGGSGIYTAHQWTGTGASFLNSTTSATPTFTPTTSGSYTFNYQVTDLWGCIGTASTTINVLPVPDASFVLSNATFCDGDAPVNMVPATAGGVFTASPSNPNPISGNSFDPSIAGAGTTQITYSISGSNNSCPASTTQSVTINATPDATITTPTSFCSTDAPVTLTANTPGGTWTGPGVSNGVFSPSVVGDGTYMIHYSVTTNGCSNSTDATITVSGSLDPTITSTGPYCPTGGIINLTATDEGVWSGPGIVNTATGEFDPSLLSPGTYTVQNTIGGNCGGTDTQDITITLNACDHDGDGVLDGDDPDDDNDGILDVDEDVNGDGDFTNDDTDGDGVPDYWDLDSDNDGIVDVIEAGGSDPDGDGVIGSGPITDADNDGLDDSVDTDQGGTPLPNPDSDNDGINDVLDLDADNDGIVDNIEAQTTSGYIPPTGLDSDNDGIDDAYDIDNNGSPITPVNTDWADEADYLDNDTDNDGDSDLLEGWDTDNDGIADTTPSGNDSDNDGIDDAFDSDGTGTVNNGGSTNGGNTPNTFPNLDDSSTPELDWREGQDHDGDGVMDIDDPDDDNDGILDVDEDANGDGIFGNDDTDGDGVPDYWDLDSDNDGIVDVIEGGGEDPDGDGVIGTGTITDVDGDGLSDIVDPDQGGTPLPNPDSDGDGLIDSIDLDSDNDGIVDNIEAQATDGYIPPIGSDTDGDGIDDAYDNDNGGTPVVPVDTDSDSTVDYLDLDSDNDLDPDVLEGWDTDNNGTANIVPSGNDSDNDGIDDAFDVDGTSSTNNGGATNGGQTAYIFPNLDDPNSTELDWREIEVLIPNIFTPNGDGMNDVFIVRGNFKELTGTIMNRWGNKIYLWKGVHNSWDGRTKSGSEASEGTYYYIFKAVDYEGVTTTYKGSFVLER